MGSDVFSLFRFLVAVGTKAGRFRKMIFSMKAEILGEPVLLSAQPLVGKLLKGSTVAADHEPMAPFFAANSTLNESTAGQNSMSQIEAAKQVEGAIDGDMIQIFPLLV